MSDKSPVLYELNGHVATITLNRPESLNAMTSALMKGLSDALARVENDPSVRVVVITGNGRGFCAGADLAAQANAGNTPNDQENQTTQADKTVDHFNAAMRAINSCPVPTVARVNGAAAGGGFGLALSCDITVAASSAFFVATFGPRLGIVPDLGTTWNLPRRAGRARALGITMLGDRVSAAQAVDWGLIWAAVEDEKLDDAIKEITDRLERSSADAMTRIRSVIDEAVDNNFSDQLDLEMAHQAVLIPRNMTEGAKAFMEKREPRFPPRE